LDKVEAESAGLGDFGDVVGDEPGFVAVPQSVEGESGADGHGAFPRVAIDCGPEHAAQEVAASEGVAVWGLDGELNTMSVHFITVRPFGGLLTGLVSVIVGWFCLVV
jgi:hypothetical protein